MKKDQLAVNSSYLNEQVHKESEMNHRYRQLTLVERYQIQAGIDLGLNISEIARQVKRHRSTVFRELKRNGHLTLEGYSALYSQQQYERRREKCRRAFIVEGSTKAWVDERLKLQWSPEQISGRRKLEGLSSIGVETIYRYLWRNKQRGGTLWHNLRHSSNRRRRRFKFSRWPASTNPRLAAENRPSIIEKRKRFGDFERDLIVGRHQASQIMTLVDRKTKFVKLAKLERKTAEVVHRETLQALKGIEVKSLTNDNGCEFIAHQITAKALGVPIYFTRPYASWERGTVENTNKLIRQYFPKKTNLKEIPDEKIQMVEMLLNHRPRKQLGYKTPIEASS